MSGPHKLSVADPDFVDKILFEVKSQGHFDAFRKECLADVDTQPAFQNLHSRVEDSVQKFLNRQVWTPETNRNRLREEMRYNIIRAGYLESGVSRIVDQVVEQKMDSIQSKVEEILYHYVGIEKPIKKEKLVSDVLEVQTDLLPTDLEQVSPDSDKKSSISDALNVDDSKGEEIEEEIVEDDDFESPAFEPIESVQQEKNESRLSSLSAISGLTSQDSMEDKPEPETVENMEVDLQQTNDNQQQQDSQLSQISSIQDMSQDMIQEANESFPVSINEEAQMPTSKTETLEEIKDGNEETATVAPDEPEKSQFDLKKDCIEFTGNERKAQPLDDSTSSEADKVLQPQDVPSNTMEIDNLYENDSTDSSEMKMEIDLKDETTQETGGSSKIEESSQESTISKDKIRSETKKDSSHHHSHHHKSDRSRDKHKSSHKSSHHHRSSSSKSHHDDKHKRSDGKSSSSSHKRSATDKHRSSSSRRDDKDKRSSKEESSKSKPRDNKVDDHQQEKSSSRRRSTDHDSNEGKGGEQDKSSKTEQKPETANTESEKKCSEINQRQESSDNKPVAAEKMTDSCEMSVDSKSSTTSVKREQKSSILVKYDYLKSPMKKSTPRRIEEIEDGFCGFAVEKLPDNPWFECLRREVGKGQKKKFNRRTSNNNYLDKKLDGALSHLITKGKAKPKVLDTTSDITPDVASKLLNGNDESKVQTFAQQRYDDDDLYKPRTDYGNRNRRRGQVMETIEEVKDPQAENIET